MRLISRVGALVCLIVVGGSLGSCGRNTDSPPTDPPSRWDLEVEPSSTSYRVGDSARYTVSVNGDPGPVQWSIEGLPANWTAQEGESRCELSGPMMIGSTSARDISVSARDAGGRKVETSLRIVANRYTMQVRPSFEQLCGIPSQQDTRCYIATFPQQFVRDPDRPGTWDAWIDTSGLRPGDKIWVFDFLPTEFESSGQTIPGHVEQTAAARVDAGENTGPLSSAAALAAIEDGQIRIRINTPSKQQYEFPMIELHVK